MYDYAIMEYEKFLITYPSAKGRDSAMFRLAESHRMLGNQEAARSDTNDSFRSSVRANLQAQAPIGLVNISTPTRNTIQPSFSSSLPPRRPKTTKCAFQPNTTWPAASSASNARTKRQSSTQRSLQSKKQPLSLVRPPFAGGKRGSRRPKKGGAGEVSRKSPAAQARPPFARRRLSKRPPSRRSSGDKQRALKLFTEAFASSEGGDWKPMAFLGAFRLNFELGAYKKVVEMSDKSPEGIPDEERAEILLLTGDSYRQLGNARAAPCRLRQASSSIPELRVLAGCAFPPSAEHVSIG